MALSSYPSMPFSISTVCCPTSGGGLGCDTANSLYLTPGPVKKKKTGKLFTVYINIEMSMLA